MVNTSQNILPYDTTDADVDADVNSSPPLASTSEPAQDTTTTSPHPSGCTHPLHPAHPSSASQICPYQNLDFLAESVAYVGSYIIDQGGARGWREAIEVQHPGDQVKIWQWVCIVRGASKTKKRRGAAGGAVEGEAAAAQQERGEVGYRVRKARLLRAVLETEQLARLETEWDLLLGSARPRAHSATNALAMLRRLEGRGVLDALERDAAAFARRRGAEWAVVAQEGFPDEEEEGDDEPGRILWFMMNEAQREYINKWIIPVEEVDSAALLASTGKKTMGSVKTISFDEQVRVCGLADIDEIAQTASSIAGSHAEKAPEEVRPLNEGPARRQSRWRRNPKTTKYRVPGAWAVAEGSEPVDTSGLRKEPAQWDKYLHSLDAADE
jgi:hypothetical protein